MKNIFFVFMLLLLSVSCSKKGFTPTKVKLTVGGLMNLTSGAGAGGGIIFGRSSQGQIFGKVLSANEETIEMPNGDWNFYALLWDSTSSTPVTPMNDVVYCGKSVQKLSGVDISVNMYLSNANCTDPEFSNGQSYVTAASKIRFADFFLEECDDLTVGPGFTCGLNNQGSALSYRMIFRDFKKLPSTGFNFGEPAIYSACQKVDKLLATDLLHKGLPVNFPSGNGTTPFVVSLELFLGNDTCTPDAKGVHTIVLEQGIGVPNPVDNKIIVTNHSCMPGNTEFTGTEEDKSDKCNNFLGSWSGTSCVGLLPMATRFAPAVACSSQTVADSAIKHLVAIPKPFLCDRYLAQSTVIGAHPFAGGNGSSERPFKICNEWQINQIGEVNAPADFESKSYKLMNDLNMNKTDFIGPYSKPICSEVIGSLIKDHHNLNSLDKIADGACTTTGSNVGFQGTFNGNGKTISNGRIIAESVSDGLGFVRNLYGGTVKNLIFKNLEVSGKNRVGAVAGMSSLGAKSPEIKNISIDELRVEGRSINGASGDYVGGVVGFMAGSGSMMKNVHINHARIKGRDFVAGLTGSNDGSIFYSHFSGDISTESSNGTRVGGLVAVNNSGAYIQNSFSEGSISSSLSYTGGVVAENSGSISNVYSTMMIESRYSSTSANIGGIVAYHGTGAILSGAFFDGVIINNGGVTPSYLNGVIGFGSGTSSNCFTSHTSPGSSCTNATYAQMRDGSRAFGVPTAWSQTAGSIPRLSWESRACLLPVNQLVLDSQVTNLGRGAEANPLVICNSTQLSALSGRSASENYRIAEDINLSAWGSGNLVSSFSGNLNGGDKIIYGAAITLATDANAYEGFFRSVTSTGIIKNLKLFGNKIDNTPDADDSGTGLLTGQNMGNINNIEMRANEISGKFRIGMLVGENAATISDIEIKEGKVTGYQSVGGVAGLATSTSAISKVYVQTAIGDASTFGSVIERFGGIAGTNSGTIDQASFGGNITTSLSSASFGLRAGGIVGQNFNLITNSYTENYSKISSPNLQGIGGLIGENTSGSINRSFALGKVIYDNAGVEASPSMLFHPLVGNISSGTVASDVFFLGNSIGSLLTSTPLTISSSCIGDGSTSCLVSSLIPTVADLFSAFNMGGGNGLNSLIPIVSKTSGYFSYTGTQSFQNGNSVNFYKSYGLGNTTGQKGVPDFDLLATFCSSWSGSLGNEVCSTGYNIAGKDTTLASYGENRILAYYKALMEGTPIPDNTPIWEFDEGEGYPKLLQLKHH